MSYISELFKEITTSKILTGALFITSGIMIFGHHYFPLTIETVPSQWLWLLKAIFLFSSSLLIFWCIQKILEFCRQAIKQSFIFNKPSKQATELLRIIVGNGDMTSHLSDIESTNKSYSMVVLLELSRELVSKGYAEQVDTYETKLRSTSKGRQYILKLFPGSSA